jgi:hypothetical protein
MRAARGLFTGRLFRTLAAGFASAASALLQSFPLSACGFHSARDNPGLRARFEGPIITIIGAEGVAPGLFFRVR